MSDGDRRMIRTRATWMAYLLLGLFAYLETAVGPTIPFIRDRLHLSYTVTSFHFAAFAIGGILVGLAGDRATRRYPNAISQWGGVTGMIAGGLLLVSSPSVVGTVFGALLMGFAGTIMLVANQTCLADMHGESRTIALAESNVAASSAAILAPIAIGGFDSVGLGWRLGMLVTVPALAVLAVVFRDLRLPEQVERPRERSGNAALPLAFWGFAATLFFGSAVEWCIGYWGADFLTTEVGLRKSAAATAMSIFFGAMVFGRLFGARLARRYRSTSLLLAALAIAAVGFPVFWLAGSSWLSLVGLFVAGIGVANFYPLTVANATNAAPEMASQASARLAISGGLAMLSMPLLVGALSDGFGLRWGFGVVLPLVGAAALATRFAMNASSRQRVPAVEASV